MDTVLGRCDITSAPPEAEPGKILKSSFYSTHRKRSVSYQIAYPPDPPAASRLPVCLYLHAYGGDETEAFESLGLHRILAASVAAGVPPFLIATVDGGDRYWHPRGDGDNPLAMVLEDFPVVLGQYGLPTTPLAIIGTSMGGYGALLAATQEPKKFAAVVATSPAVWHSYDEAHTVNESAFDSPDDFRQYGDMRTRVDKLTDIHVRIDCGEADPFEPNLRSLREQLPDPASLHIAKGCHDMDFWRAVAPDQLALIGNALTPPPAPPA
jgi:enterochelin esterase-like enzyme